MAFPPPVMFARFLNVISRPRSKANHRVFHSKRDAACSPNTDRLHRQRKSTPIAPICSRTSVNIFDVCWEFFDNAVSYQITKELAERVGFYAAVPCKSQ